MCDKYRNLKRHPYLTASRSDLCIALYNYMNDIKPMDLRVFQMISGLITPKSVGINDPNDCFKLIKASKIAIRFGRMVELSIGFLIVFILLSLFAPPPRCHPDRSAA